ncbi:MAG: hypothetical protein J5635_02165 [Paludibacteraceae bacterium]|nr:hypothetical protein [Paludibacteraceae bacterium]
MKTKSMLAALFFAALGFVSCQQKGGDLFETDMKIADQTIPGTYACQANDVEAQVMTVYEYVLDANGTGTYTVVSYGNGVQKATATTSFQWKRGVLAEDKLSIPITLTFPTGEQVVTWANGTIEDDIAVCGESAKAANYEKVIDALPNTAWKSVDTTYYINMLEKDSMAYAWKNQRDTLTQIEIDATNLYLTAHADEIREAMGMQPTDPVQVNVLKDLGNGQFQVIFPHYVGTKVHYTEPDTIGPMMTLFSTLSFLRNGKQNVGAYAYHYKEYKLNADTTDVVLYKQEDADVNYNWHISSVVNAKKFYVDAVAADTTMSMLISAFDKSKGKLDFNEKTYTLVQ